MTHHEIGKLWLDRIEWESHNKHVALAFATWKWNELDGSLTKTCTKKRREGGVMQDFDGKWVAVLGGDEEHWTSLAKELSPEQARMLVEEAIRKMAK